MSVRSNALIISMFVAATLTGCDRDPIAGKPHIGPAAVSPHNAYAGAPVTIRAAGLEKLQSVEIWTDTFPLTVLARGGDSVVAELPRTARGSYTLQLGKNGPPLGGVNIIGYVGEKPTPRLLGDRPGWGWGSDQRSSHIRPSEPGCLNRSILRSFCLRGR